MRQDFLAVLILASDIEAHLGLRLLLLARDGVVFCHAMHFIRGSFRR